MTKHPPQRVIGLGQVGDHVDLRPRTPTLTRQCSGKPEDSYALLLKGCRRAQEAAAGQGALLDRWRGALERYGDRWPVGRA
jgi:hypothetical protein